MGSFLIINLFQAQLIFFGTLFPTENGNGTICLFSKVYSENINANPPTFAMKLPDELSKIPTAPSHVTNAPSQMLMKAGTSPQ